MHLGEIIKMRVGGGGGILGHSLLILDGFMNLINELEGFFPKFEIWNLQVQVFMVINALYRSIKILKTATELVH